MNTSGKITTTLGIIIGILGLSIGVYAVINPMAIATFLENPWIATYGEYIFWGFIALVVLTSMFPLFSLGMRRIKFAGVKKRLREFGSKTTATVVSVKDTGVTVNLAPLVRLTVETQQHVRGTFDMFVSRVGFPSPGDQIEIVFNPNDPSEMMPASQLQ